MKMHERLTILGLMVLLGLAAPSYAYQYIGAGTSPNCQQCHNTTYTIGSDWHTKHQANANNDCTKCHDAEQKVLTKNCTGCHASSKLGIVPKSGTDGCGWVTDHITRGQGTCTTCHSACETNDPGTCTASYCLGSNDPRLDTLRKFRDNVLAKSAAGQKIIKLYYASGDSLNTYLDAHPAVKSAVIKMLESFAAAIEPVVKK
ncbi:MAG: cytochrome c3 family protein [Pseudomonadota bacterium]